MQNHQPHSPYPTSTATKDLTKNPFILVSITLLSLLLLLSLSSSLSPPKPPPQLSSPPSSLKNPFLFPNHQYTSKSPSIAYFISGSSGDFSRIIRLLFAIYHPKNHYLIHLDLGASQQDRESLALLVQSIPVFRAAKNVDVIGKGDFAYRKGSSEISSTLRAAAILLRLEEDWDWFVNLGPRDYPLVTQDDLLHILSFLPKQVNFVNHTSYIGWGESRKLKPIIVDPGLYLSEKTEMFYASQKRELPSAFRLFTGSYSAILSRSFIEFCISGTDNLPRTVLMYLSNTRSSLPNYFPTILCNSQQFNKTIINDNLLYASSEKPLKEEPRSLGSNDFDNMIQSGAAFATQFSAEDPVLDRIDREMLGRRSNQPVPGGWCLGDAKNGTCSVWGNAEILRPGPGAERLEKRIVELLSNGMVNSRQCIVE